jgi:hypothetical protein
MTLSTDHVDSRESPTEPETVENDKQLPYLVAEAKQSLEVNIETVDDALWQREEQIEEIRNRFEMRLQNLLKDDPLLELREQVHALRDCHPDLVKTTSDSDAASSITSNLTVIEDDEDGDSDDGSSDDDFGQLSKEGHSRAFTWSPSFSYMRQVDEEAELIIPDAARLDRIMETLEKDTSPTSHTRRTPRSVKRALTRGSTANMHDAITHDAHNMFSI